MTFTLVRTGALRYPLRLVVDYADGGHDIFEGDFAFCAHIAASLSRHYA